MGFLTRLFGHAPVASAPAPIQAERQSFFSTHVAEDAPRLKWRASDYIARLVKALPRIDPKSAMAMDDYDGNGEALSMQMAATAQNIPDVLAMWYSSQTFIGYQLCAILAQHWLIDKACTMPARDAVRQGYDIVNVDGDSLDPEALKIIHKADRAMRLNWNLEQFVRMGRIFGVRVAIFKVESQDPEYYEKPFNPDGVTPGSYKGIVQVDPYWLAPELDFVASSRPEAKHFYEPTWWRIGDKRYHRTHLVIFRNSELPDLLKPQYMYGGVPVPQRIMERVYGAERTANEAPQLVQTKRSTVWLTDMAKFIAAGADGVANMQAWANYRDNLAIKIGDKEGDSFDQFDTSLADLDNVIMTQYQIVAAAAEVPSTKLLGTAPKGFNATGEFDEASYHESLESIQTHDLTPFIERHHLLVMRSHVAPKIAAMVGVETTINWRPLDSPTAKELAETNLVKAQTGAALIASGALDSQDERARLAMDPSSGYSGVDLSEPMEDPDAGLEGSSPNDDDPEANR